MIVCTRRIASIAVIALLAIGVAACGDKEPEQRKAFMAFLQTRILDKQGVRVPKPNDEETKSFGPYAEHYAVITGFNAEIDKAMAGPYRLAQTNAPRSVQDLLDRRQEIATMRDTMTKMVEEMRKTLAATQTKREALKQPDDLKPVYTAAYDRSVTAPALVFLATVPVAIDGLNASLQLADYLDSHRTTVKVSGSSIEAKDAKTRTEVNKLMTAMTAHSQKLGEARTRMRIVFEGK